MSLFFDVLSSINNPNQQASVSQLDSITSSLQQLSASSGIQPNQMQSMMTVLGGALRPMLQKQQSTMGGNQLGGLIGQLANGGRGGNASLMQSVFTPQLQQQLTQLISQKTGISSSLVQMALPTLIPAVLSLLNMGSPKPGVQGSNSILDTFLNSKNDSDIDLGHVFQFANRFLNPGTI
ncbi:DUF937 domain-containing protein [Egbenema bharatensis]|uniref:DUF937 domain-containing protein n=1 Tax=Egbenema bharatensis TaxID=3463334 RepID=UPI003A86932B